MATKAELQSQATKLGIDTKDKTVDQLKKAINSHPKTVAAKQAAAAQKEAEKKAKKEAESKAVLNLAKKNAKEKGFEFYSDGENNYLVKGKKFMFKGVKHTQEEAVKNADLMATLIASNSPAIEKV